MVCASKWYAILLLGALFCLLLTACRTKQTVLDSAPLSAIDVDTTALPTFSGGVLYVLGREWEAIYDSTSAKYDTPKAQILRADSISMAEYVEQRLVELYPEKAYKGYVDNIHKVVYALLSANTTNPKTEFAPTGLSFVSEEGMYQQLSGQGINIASVEVDSAILSSDWNDSQVFDSLVLVRYGEDSLTMSFAKQNAVQDLSVLDSIALAPEWADRQTMDTLEWSWFEEENLLLSMMLWRGPRFFYRIIQSKARAEKMAAYYYGEQTNSGMQGDAFRHIYVNVLLRSYVGEWVSHVVMDIFWETISPNAPCDRYMDLHNNILGRSTLYGDFVRPALGSQGNEEHSWLQWAEYVHQFVQDSVNSYRPQWNQETPTFIVQPEAQRVDNGQYIYWAK